MGVMLLGEANREAPAQAELRPTRAGPAMSKRQRVEWASCVNLHLILTPMGLNPGLNGAKLGNVRGLSFAPKRHENLAQGFNPGNRTSPAKSPERAPDRMRQSTHLTNNDLSPLQGESPCLMVPRVETLG
jgi:hypothetical protein